jgi:hypothetical protein
MKKGADKGIDGRLYFSRRWHGHPQIVISVKGGKLKATDVRICEVSESARKRKSASS